MSIPRAPAHGADAFSSTVRPRMWELPALAAASSAALFGVIAFYDNVHRATTNGLSKSLYVVPWVAGAPDRWTDGDNMLYYPVVGALVRALPESAFGAVWQRMAFVNALFGAAVLAMTYLIALRLFRSRATAFFACACQLAMAFFLLLSTINEDIMPGYAFFVAAVACAVCARRVTPRVTVLAAQCVALSWLFHSTLRLPGIAAFLLGIAVTEETWRRRLASAALFLAALVPLPVLSALSFELPWHAGLWSSKGLGTAWGGFSINKIAFMWGGIAQSVAGGQNLSSLDQIVSGPLRISIALTMLVVTVGFAVWLVEVWRRRAAPEWRMAGAVLTGAFVFGETMNLYIQPQDPQMQIQPMTWFPFAVACLYALTARLDRWTVIGRTVLATLAAALFASNLEAYAGSRHADSAAPGSARALEALAPPERTMFLLQGFEGMSTWLMVLWGWGSQWPPVDGRAVGTRAFHGIYITTEIIVYPSHQPSEAADTIVLLVDAARERGFDVVATDIWAAPEETWVSSFATISGPEKPLAIRAALQAKYSGTAIGRIPGWGTMYRIVPKAP
jgi:hypothetical protein